MSNLILPQKWTSQPQTPVQIDWSNPLTKNLKYVLSAAHSVELVTGAPLLRTGTVAFSVNKSGITQVGNLSGIRYLSIPSTTFSSGDLTLVGISGTNPSSGQVNIPYGLGNSGGTAFFSMQTSNGFGGNGFAARQTNGGGTTSRKYSTNLSTAVSGSNTVVQAGVLVGNSTLDAYWNGQLDNGTLATGSTGTNSYDRIAIGGTVRSANYPSDAVNSTLVLFFSEALSASKIKALSDNPWQIFKPQSRRIWVGAAGGTNTAVNPGTGSIAITGYAPSIAQTANQAITPNVGNIVITGYAPTISQPQAVNPGVGSLTITGYAPTVTQNVDTPVNPGVGTIAITGYAPAVSQTANQLITPDVGNIAITGYSPTVSQSANQAVTPDVGTITITGYAPIVQQAPASQNITPDVGTITITGYAPTVEQSSPLRLGGFEYGSKVYIKRNKKIYIFDSVEEADSYLEAEAKVEEIVQQSNRTSRLARKRAREKAHKLLSIEPVESVDIPALKTLVSQLQTGFELPQLIAKQDWQRVVEIYQQAMEMQDEEDLLLIL